MRIISWNVNGIRAALRKGFFDWFYATRPDILCLQETKAHHAVLPPEVKVVDAYHVVYCAGERKGYSGTSTWSKEKPSDVTFGFGRGPEFDREGRIIHSRFEAFDLLNIYFPNGGEEKVRVPYKMAFYEACQDYCRDLMDAGRKLIICGDVNTAHHEIDLARPQANQTNTGFLPEERAWIDRFLAEGYIDVWRELHPETIQYSWWSYRGGARQRNVGWRLDYFFVSPDLWDRVVDSDIHTAVEGSDHCPVSLDLDL